LIINYRTAKTIASSNLKKTTKDKYNKPKKINLETSLCTNKPSPPLLPTIIRVSISIISP